jgi:hypothetical protein
VEKSGMLKAAFLLFLLILFPVIGAGVIVSSLGMLGKADSASNWPTVRGEILSSQVVTELASTWGESGGSARKPTEVYSAQVRYEYIVDGKTYRGQRISLQQAPSTDRYQAELTAIEFNKGETTVYYDPKNPQDALLAPQEVGDIISGIVIGFLLMIVPSGMILVGLRYEFIDRPEVPLHVRLWWETKFGKHRGRRHNGLLQESSIEQESPVDEARPAEGSFPVGEDFIEAIVQWDPRTRIELASLPSSIWVYVMMGMAFGLIVAWAGMFPLTHLLYRRDTPHGPELGSVFGFLFVTTSALVFFVSRVLDRGSKTVIDWNSGSIWEKREFSFSRQLNISDVRRVVVRCVPVKGRRRKYRALIEVDGVGSSVAIAHTCQPRRKPESAREKAARLADPLASALDVPVDFEGWEA